MITNRLVLAAALSSLGLIAVRTSADEPPRLTDDEFKGLFKQLHIKNQLWATIPWRASITAARLQAARERKPIFLVVNTGNCLGWV